MREAALQSTELQARARSHHSPIAPRTAVEGSGDHSMLPTRDSFSLPMTTQKQPPSAAPCRRSACRWTRSTGDPHTSMEGGMMLL